MPRVKEQGIRHTPAGWVAVTIMESAGKHERLIAGPFAGAGARRLAIRAAGTNRVIA